MASFLEDSSKTVTEVRNDLVCQICDGHARPGKKQWYRCLRLHQICQQCIGKQTLIKNPFSLGGTYGNKTCNCGQPISLEYCRQTEKLLGVKGLKFNCINMKNGCQEAHTEDAIEEHESECIYRFVPCPFSAMIKLCHAVIFQDVIQHYEKVHLKKSDENEVINIEDSDLEDEVAIMDQDEAKDQNTVQQIEELSRQDLSVIYSGKMGQIILEGYGAAQGQGHPIKYCLNNHIFLLAERVSNDVVYKWVYILGSLNEAKHFSYTLKLMGNESEISVKGKVAAIDEPFDTLYKAGKCFAIPLEALTAQLVDEDQKYEYSLEIRNRKEEVKDVNYESGISDNE